VADPYLTAQQARDLGAEPVNTDELRRRGDFVTIHAPALPGTHHLLDARRLALLQDGATLINTARGSLVDTTALADHCATGRLDAVLDVTDPDPLPLDHPLLRLPTVLSSPHTWPSRRAVKYAASASSPWMRWLSQRERRHERRWFPRHRGRE
jgi:phosphoglycerate dehydrogenase-like enzyme